MRFILPLIPLLCAAPAHADEADTRAIAAFTAAFAEACTAAFAEDGSLIEPPQRFTTIMPQSYSTPVPVKLWQFRCNIGAYNLQSVFMAQTEYYGITPLAFARPDLDVVLEDPENYEGPVKAINITGWSAAPYVVNATFDPSKAELTENSYWRGIGDASSTAVWTLIDDSFRLIRYDVDATYDGEVNPKTLVSFP
jgi:hypothetical protein